MSLIDFSVAHNYSIGKLRSLIIFDTIHFHSPEDACAAIEFNISLVSDGTYKSTYKIKRISHAIFPHKDQGFAR